MSKGTSKTQNKNGSSVTPVSKARKLAIIGGGNMARSLIGGLLHDGWKPRQFRVADPNASQRDLLSQTLGVTVFEDNQEAAAGADGVVLAVKPQALSKVARELAPALIQTKPLIISVVAGIRTADIQRWIGAPVPIVRVMPNTPALVAAGASGLYATPEVNNVQVDFAESMMRAVGLVVWIQQEYLMDSVTALSGSGPAYLFLVLEAMEDAAVAQGLDRRTARLLTLQTVFGAAKMALESEDTPATLRSHVTSPGGTTAAGVRELERGMRDLFYQAIAAAAARSEAIANHYGAEGEE
ncbi:pyrroline-5-carboxylate reductase [Thermithiobacillus plumbiphilus]|uniref:Pyrroline-5-carboxylate reductase n=1 Tax=Thermithiobacillus plumbiphilus TaxID=1729899 RepID=A0ABU9D639_9PROT